MKDDKGFSLVELIVIIAIMGALLTFGIVKSEVIFSYNAQEAYKKVMSTLATEKTQVLAHSTLASGTTAVFQNDGTTLNSDVVSKGVYIEFYVNGNSIYTKTYVQGNATSTEGKKVAGKGVTMICKVKDRSGAVTDVPVSGGEGHGICFSYDRSTGAFLPYQTDKYVEEIHVYGGSREYVIRLMKKTGKAVRHGK